MAKTIADWKKTYRPRSFSEVIGQDDVVNPLRTMCKNGAPTSNAFLFSGTKGTGKTTNARLLAAGLNCEHLSEDGDPCGKCANCQTFLAGEGEEYSCAGFNVDSVRSLKDRLNVRSHYNWRVVIMDEAQEMNSKVSSEFLKILEEPPAGVVFAFCTTRENKIERALRSRMTRYQTKNVPVDVIIPHIRMIAENENIEFTDDDLSMVARGSEGSVRLAIGRLQEFADGLPLSDPTISLDLATAMVDGRIGEALYTIKKAEAADALNPREVVEELREFYSNLLMAQHCEDWQTILGNQSGEEYVSLIEDAASNDLISHAEIIRGLSACSHAVAAMDRGNSSNAQLEATVVRILEPEEDRLAKRFVQLLEETIDDSDGKIIINVQNIQESRTSSGKKIVKSSSSDDSSAGDEQKNEDIWSEDSEAEESWVEPDGTDAEEADTEADDAEGETEEDPEAEIDEDADDDAVEEEEDPEAEEEDQELDDPEEDTEDEDDLDEEEANTEDESDEEESSDALLDEAIAAITDKAAKRKSNRISSVLSESIFSLEEDEKGSYILIEIAGTASEKMLGNIERVASSALKEAGFENLDVSADFASDEEDED